MIKETTSDDAPVERYIEADGTVWIRVWRAVVPGLLQLVWVTEAKAIAAPAEVQS